MARISHFIPVVLLACYAVATLLLGAWLADVMYNGLMAAQDLAVHRPPSKVMDSIEQIAQNATYLDFYKVGIIGAAILLFFPWLEIHSVISARIVSTYTGLFSIPATGGALGSTLGQSLQPVNKGPLLTLLSCIVSIITIAAALYALSYFSLINVPAEAIHKALTPYNLALAFLAANVMEALFRGVAFGIFLRAMHPAFAILLASLFCTAVMALFLPPAALEPLRPEVADGLGRSILGDVCTYYLNPGRLYELTPVFIMSLALSITRWLTASLWLPIGLHLGWIICRYVIVGVSLTRDFAAQLHHAFVYVLYAVIVAVSTYVACLLFARYCRSNVEMQN